MLFQWIWGLFLSQIIACPTSTPFYRTIWSGPVGKAGVLGGVHKLGKKQQMSKISFQTMLIMYNLKKASQELKWKIIKTLKLKIMSQVAYFSNENCFKKGMKHHIMEH